MALIRTKNNVPTPYVTESRDFQLFTRVLDFVQNSVKFDIDSMTNIIDPGSVPSDYLGRLKSKIGFFTSNSYSDEALRKVLSAFPYIIRYKGSEIGIRRCINTYLNVMGIKDGYMVDIYNNDDSYNYTVRIGINADSLNTTLLFDMLSYVLPTGYFVEVYFYNRADSPAEKSVLKSRVISLTPPEEVNTQVRTSKVAEEFVVSATKEEHRTLNTVQVSTVYDPTNKETS